MKNITRGTLATIALASLLAVTACGSSSENVDQGTAPESAIATPSVDTNKAPGFYTTYGIHNSVPADWKSGEGIATAKSFAIGEYVAYIPTKSEGSPENSADPHKLYIIDGKGTIVYQSKTHDDGSTVSSNHLNRVFADGKPYLVFNQTLETKPDPTSTRNAEKSIFLVVIDAQGKEVASHVIKDNVSVNFEQDAVTLFPAEKTVTHKIVDVTTGEISELPAAPKDYSWSLKWDGVNIFERTRPNDFSPSYGKLTNGEWTVETGTDSDMLGTYTKLPTPFGGLMLTERASSGYNSKGSDLVDPHTGKVVYGADLKEGVEFKYGVPSADNKMVVAQNEHEEGIGVYSIADNKYYPIPDEFNFFPTSVTNDGYVYGNSNGKRAGYNILKDTEPKILADVHKTPAEVSDSGIGIFNDGDNKSYVVLKPQS